MKITEQELMEDAKNSKLSGYITGYTYGTYSGLLPMYKLHINYDEVSVPCLVDFINFYLEKKSKDKEGDVVVTTNEDGECILVSRQDEDHNILKVIWEKK